MQDDRHDFSRLMVAIMFLYAFVLWSPVTALMGFRWTYFAILCNAGVILVSHAQKRAMKSWFLFLALSSATSSAFISFYWVEPRFLPLMLNFVTGIFILSQATYRELDALIRIASWFIVVVLIGAVMGYFLAAAGMPPLMEFQRASSSIVESVYFFGTTLTNVYFDDNAIRPSGIYDEPGALSFVVCIIAFCRHATGKDYKLTWLILGLGLITISLAHMVFVLLYFLSERLSFKKMVYFVCLVLALVAAIFLTDFSQMLQNRFLWRFAVTESGALAGDNRSAMMKNAADGLAEGPGVFFMGLGPEPVFEPEKFIAEHGKMGENPLHPLVMTGIFVAWPYYAFLALALLLVVKARSNLAFLGVALLFAQRPYLFSFGYSLLGVIAIWLQTNERYILAFNRENRKSPFKSGAATARRGPDEGSWKVGAAQSAHS